MHGQAKKSYLNILRHIDKNKTKEKPPAKSTGLLGRTAGSAKKADKGKAEPIDRVAKVVNDIRIARMEIKNGKEPITND